MSGLERAKSLPCKYTAQVKLRPSHLETTAQGSMLMDGGDLAEAQVLGRGLRFGKSYKNLVMLMP